MSAPLSAVDVTAPEPSAAEPWHPRSWRARPAAQQPDWPDPQALRRVTDQLCLLPPLVSSAENHRLLDRLGRAALGDGFLLQAGDCAESDRSFFAEAVYAKVQTIAQMAMTLAVRSGLPVVKVGRIAGQMAKPRSQPFEVVETPEGPLSLPSYRGDMVNDPEPDARSRRPDPERLLRAYYRSTATLNLLRTLSATGFAAPAEVHAWTREYVAADAALGARFTGHVNDVDRLLRYLDAHRETGTSAPEFELFTSHEALLLPYEEALSRWDQEDRSWYGASGHLLWVGERTRQLDGAHLEFVSGIANPVAVKVGPGMEPGELLELCRRLDPRRTPGRLTLITRMGAGRIREALPRLVTAVREEGHPVLWVCDPMHGNTWTSSVGLKTRRFDDIVEEVCDFFSVLRAAGAHPGGLHLELTGEDVTECVGGSPEVREDELGRRYETTCDPRLNRTQALELSFLVADLLAEG